MAQKRNCKGTGGPHVHSRDWPLSPEQEPPAGSMAVRLTQGFVAWVSEEDFGRVSEKLWCFAKSVKKYECGYALLNTYTKIDGKWRCKPLTMHRFILGGDPSLDQIDHKVHRGDIKVVDNRRENLRFCNGKGNSANKKKLSRPSSSPFKGVSKSLKKWKSATWANGSSQHFGSFWNEGYAALVYDLAAVKEYGEFALTNFPVPGSERWLFGPGCIGPEAT